MSAIEFYCGYTSICGIQENLYIKVQISFQAKTFPLVRPNWSSPDIVESPFILTKCGFFGTPEAGVHGNADLVLEADNYNLGNGLRFWDLIRGKAIGYTFLPDSTYMHVRVLVKKHDWLAYKIRFWGTVDFKSIEMETVDILNEDSYKIKVSIKDCIYQLEDATISRFVDYGLKHVDYDYTSTYKLITAIGNITYAGSTFYPGKYFLYNVRWNDGDGHKHWLGNIATDGSTLTPFSDSENAVKPIRFFKLVDIFTSMSMHLDLEADINDGANWSDIVKWKFLYNSGDSTSSNSALNTVLNNVTFDELYIISGIYVWDGTQAVYAHRGMFFDGQKVEGFSFFNYANPFEVARIICNSFGLVMRIRVNADNERYLEIVPIDYPTIIDNWGYSYKWGEKISIKPFDEAISGIEITSPGIYDILRGSVGNESIKMDCFFSLASICRTDHDFRRYNLDNPGFCLFGHADGREFWSSLWTLQGTKTLNNYDYAYSICAIVPGTHGISLNDTFGGTSPYIEELSLDGYAANLALGKIVTTYGGIDFTESAKYSNVVMYPNDIMPFNTWSEVLPMALSHYLYSPKNLDSDKVGFFRSKGMLISLTYESIYDNPPYPGSIFSIYIGGETLYGRCIEAIEDYKTGKTHLTLKTWI
jgi:hypothetical protein